MLGLGTGLGLSGQQTGVPFWVPRNPATGRAVTAYASVAKRRYWARSRLYGSLADWMAALGLAVGGAGGVRTEYDVRRGVTKYGARVLRPAYDAANGSLKGIRFWSDSANLALRSEEFDNAVWSKGSGGITPDIIVAPDGADTADLFTGTGSPCIIRNSNALTVMSGATYMISWFVKRGNFDWLCFRAAIDLGVTNGVSLWVNIATGAVGSTIISGTAWSSPRAAKVTALADGWLRISYWVTTGGTTLWHQIRAAQGDTLLPSPDTGSGLGIGNTFFAWGAQITQGLSEAPYVQTTSAAVTASADYLTITPQVKTDDDLNRADAHSAILTSNGTSLAVLDVSGNIVLTGSGGTDRAIADIQMMTVPGKVYELDFVLSGNAVNLAVGTSQGNGSLISGVQSVGARSYSFIAVGTTTWIRATLSSVGSGIISELSCRQATNLVSNGNFTSDLTGWANVPSGTATWQSANRILLTSNGNQARIRQQYTGFIPGKVYKLSWDCFSDGTTGSLGFVSPDGSVNTAVAPSVNAAANMRGNYYFIAGQSNYFVVIGCSSSGDGASTIIGNVVVEECTYLGMDKPVPDAGLTLGMRMLTNEPTDGTSTVFGYPVIFGTDSNNNRLNVRAPTGSPGGTNMPAAVLGDGAGLDSYIPPAPVTSDTFFRFILGTAAAAPPGSGFSITGQPRVEIARAAAVDPASPCGFFGVSINGVVDEILVDDVLWSASDRDAWVAAA